MAPEPSPSPVARRSWRGAWRRTGRRTLAGGPRPGRPERGGVVGAVLLGVVVLLAAACGTSGRALRDPAPGATAPPRKAATTTTQAFVPGPDAGLAITSDAWAPGGEVPATYTCDGEDTSPPLTLSGIPTGTVELVLVVSDPDAGGFVHWVVAGIPADTVAIPAGTLPAPMVEVPGTAGNASWSGPCPPPGPSHRYEFTLSALGSPSGLGPASTLEEVDAAVADALSVSVMTGTYARS